MAMTSDQVTDKEREALDVLFDWAERDTGTSGRCRRLLFAWWNGRELGGYDFSDLWSLDDNILEAVMTTIRLIARAPQGTYLDETFDGGRYNKRMRALADARWQYLQSLPKTEPSMW